MKRIHGNTCNFPGCTHRRFLDAHHVVHWAAGGKTTIDNLVLICTKHHRALHEGGYTVKREDGELVYRSPRGTILRQAPEQPTIAPQARALVDIPTPPPPNLDPGEFFTERTNLECSMEWLMLPAEQRPA